MPRERSVRWWLVASAVVVVAMGLSAWATEGMHDDRGISPLWPPAGIALAWLTATGWRGVPAVVLGRLAGVFAIDGWWLDDELAMQLVRAAAVTAAYLVAATGLRAVGMEHARVREFGWFAVFGVLLGPALAATLVGLGDLLTTDVALEDAVESSRTFWIGDAVGVATVAPLLLLVDFARRHGRRRPRLPTTPVQRVETALQALAVVLTPILALAIDTRDGTVTPLLALAVLPLVWVALRQDLIVAAAGVLVLNLVIAVTATVGLGAGTELVELQVVMLSGALAAYYVASLVHTTTEAVADLRESEARYRLLTSATPDLVVRFDLDGSVSAHNEPVWAEGASTWASAIARRLQTGWDARVAALAAAPPDEPPDLHEELAFDRDWVSRLAADSTADDLVPGAAASPAAGTGDAGTPPRQVVRLDVRVLPERRADGSLGGVVAVATDRTREREATAQLAWEQLHDPLTGLANGTALRDRLTSDIARTGPDVGQAAVAVLDLDGFRLVNHARGHAVGDEVLRSVATALRRAARPGDLTARLGGDSYAVALWIRPGHQPDAVAHPFLAAVRGAEVAGEGLRLTASIGLAVASDRSSTAADLLRDADTAMNVAKELGRDRVAVFDASQRADALDRQATLSGLQRAIDGDGLVVHFQPVVSLESGVATSVEALVRWRSPGGLRYPGEFIELAEEVGLDVPLGARVLDLAVGAMARYHADGADGLGLSVNVTARQLAEPGFTEGLLATCERHGLAPDHLALELTETSVMSDPARTIGVMDVLRREGVGVALDDFGTGYSSIAYLQQLPVDVLKIDRAFVSGLPGDHEARAIVALVVGLSSAMGIEVTAEGVETDEQRRSLLELGCRSGQGYLFARPEDPGTLLARMPLPAVVDPWPGPGDGVEPEHDVAS